MKLEKRFRKLCLLAEALAIDEEDFRQRDREYESQFRSDFALERAFLSQASDEIANAHGGNDISSASVPKTSIQSIKRLHRALARETHPDLDHVENSIEFMNIQKAYEEADVSSLLSAAVKYEIDINLDDDDTNQLERQLDEQMMMLKVKRSRIWWVWCTSDKSGGTRKKIRAAMGIDAAKFKAWSDKIDSETTHGFTG